MANRTTSKDLYQYLCDKIGTQKVVKARRTFFKVKDYLDNSVSLGILENISSGSKSEGLDLPGSDIDFMVMDKINVIQTEYPDRKSLPSRGQELFLDTNNAPPGFAQIKANLHQYELQNRFIYVNGIKMDLLQVKRELILPNTSFKHFFTNFVHEITLPGLMTHGPSTSFINESVDFVFCFRLDKWPREALNWISRPRFQDWPPEDLIFDIFHEEKSVLLVPIGSKFGAAEDNPHEWRISFSVAEKMLVHNFNHTQILCYAMLKIVLKQVLDKEAKNLLCSYFMKTLLFWLIEETGVSMWTLNNLLKCFQACISKLSYHIKYEYFPNYFIVQNNMFEGKSWGDSQTRLLNILHDIHTEGINFTLRTETLKDFILLKTTNQIGKETDIKYHDKDKAIYPLVQYMNTNTTPSLNNLLTKNEFSLSTCKSNLIKSLFSMHFVEDCIDTALKTKYDINRTNKHSYPQYKSLLPYFVLGTNLNLNGWLPLAAFFYQHKQFYNTLKIVDFVCSEITNKQNTIQTPNLQFSNRQAYKYILCKGSSFLQRYKSICIKPIQCFVKPGTVFDKGDFALEPLDIYGAGHYDVFDESQCKRGHYIRFMCFHHLHDVAGRRRALRDLQLVVDNTDTTQNNSHYIMYALKCLLQAYEISNMTPPYRNITKMWEFMHNNPELCKLMDSILQNLNMN